MSSVAWGLVRLVPLLLVALAVAPLAAATHHGGNGVGASVGSLAVGTMDIWRVYVNAPGTLSVALTWVASPVGADYDLTLWRPGADLDGVLAQGEMLASSWTRSRTPGEAVSHAVTANPQAYVVTVDAASAELETYYVTSPSGHTLTRTCHHASPAFTCLWAGQGVRQRS